MALKVKCRQIPTTASISVESVLVLHQSAPISLDIRVQYTSFQDKRGASMGTGDNWLQWLPQPSLSSCSAENGKRVVPKKTEGSIDAAAVHLWHSLQAFV
jgi:hypothetical protein